MRFGCCIFKCKVYLLLVISVRRCNAQSITSLTWEQLNIIHQQQEEVSFKCLPTESSRYEPQASMLTNLESINVTPANLRESDLQVCSQFGEDGALLLIFAALGFRSRRALEICGGSGYESIVGNLVLNHAFKALLFDGHEARVKTCNNFFATMHKQGILGHAICQHSWITREKIGRESWLGFTTIFDVFPSVKIDLDLLAIDIDGIDLHVLLPLLDHFAPRVIVHEYKDIAGPDLIIAAPYSPNFTQVWLDGVTGADCIPGSTFCEPAFGGASLSAFIAVLQSRNYFFIGCANMGFNAFHVHGTQLGRGILPTTPLDSGCFSVPKTVEGMERRWPIVEAKRFPWKAVNTGRDWKTLLYD